MAPAASPLEALAGRSKWGALLAIVLVVALWWFTSSGTSEDEEAPSATSSEGTRSPEVTTTAEPTPTLTPRLPVTERSTASARPSVTARPAPPRTSATDRHSARPSAAPSATAPTAPRKDSHGFTWVDASALPHPAGEVLAAIDDGGPFEYAPKDGSVFGNFEGLLPKRERGYYREYTVETPGVNHRGARRIVTGRSGEFYWTDDHYSSFERIRR